MKTIYCDSVFDHKTIEPDYEAEQQAALQTRFDCALISLEALVSGNVATALRYVKAASNKELAIYRGWMLTPQQYESLYNGLLSKNIQLINSPAEYQHCHYLPASYAKIAANTPLSHWTTDLSDASLKQLAAPFGNSPILVKDYVKSEKHHWEEACFIPNASDFDHVKKVVSTFVELRGEALNEGIVFRQFEALEFLTDHSQSGMPLTKEYRLFFANHQLVSIFNYWDEGHYDTAKPNLDVFKEIALTIESNFFTMDIAQKKDGNWIIIELGDGQVAGLPDNANRIEFYRNLKKHLVSS